jgi:two-component system, sensor histidine kinase
MLPRVFDLFAQVESSLDRAQGGLGIGLTLVRSLVGLHGGQVTVTSEGVGRGSEFTVSLPRRYAIDDLPSATSPRPTGAVPKHSIVLIEDNPDSRELMKTLLEAFGHRVVAAADGEEGVARVLALRPDVVIVDIGLPKLDGYAVARRVRATLGERVLLIAITGYSQPDDQRQALQAGFDAHYAKPVDPHRLQRLLGTRREARGG